MAILTLQKRARELGRIRIGQVVTGNNGKKRPEKLDCFRVTGSSKTLIEKVAALYGGEVKEWTPQNGGPSGWEVVTDSTRLPILVPPQPVSQYFELWSGGECERRCDGVTNLLTDEPCVCSPDPEDRECKPTTRLNVVLRDVEGIGVWRLESHGWYAATELPEVAEFLAHTQGYVAAHLALEERLVKRAGKTKRFMVPTLEVDITPSALMAGETPAVPQVAAGAAHVDAPALPAARQELEAAPSRDEDTRSAIAAATTLDELRQLWRDRAPLSDEMKAEFQTRVKTLEAQVETAPSGDPDELWSRVLRTVPSSWTSAQAEADFEGVVGTEAGEADAVQIQEYLDVLRNDKEDAS